MRSWRSRTENEGEHMSPKISWRCCVLSVVCCWVTPLDAQQNPNGQIPVAGMADPYLIQVGTHEPAGRNAPRAADTESRPGDRGNR